jgi:hypothetical protein
LFDNTQNQGNISPYLTTEVSPYTGIMVIDWHKVLWKRKYDWAYADDLKILGITKKLALIELNPPDGEIEKILININSGDEISVY